MEQELSCFKQTRISGSVAGVGGSHHVFFEHVLFCLDYCLFPWWFLTYVSSQCSPHSFFSGGTCPAGGSKTANCSVWLSGLLPPHSPAHSSIHPFCHWSSPYLRPFLLEGTKLLLARCRDWLCGGSGWVLRITI